MIKIKFLDKQEVKDGEGIVIERWAAGQVVELNNASARFWLSRGLASDVRTVAREAREAKEAEAVEETVAEIKAGPVEVDAKEPEAAEKKPEVEAAEEKAPPKTGKINPTSRGSGPAKRSYVRRQAQV